MVTLYPSAQVRRDRDRPTAITDVLFAGSSSTYPGTGDILLGTPTSSARSRHGLWALYAVGDGVAVVWPGGAMVGAPAEVAGQLEHLDPHGQDDLDRGAVWAIRQFLTDPDADPDAQNAAVWPATRARTWSRPAVGSWLSGPTNQSGAAGDHKPPSWPGAPARLPRPTVALPTAPAPESVQPGPSQQPAPQRAA
jgi:hypothetical protein